MKNKKLVLSVMSTALVASMASSAFAAGLKDGLYLGGDLDKYYSIQSFFSAANEENAIKEVGNVVGFKKTVVVLNGKAAVLEDFLKNDTAALKDPTADMFAEGPYQEIDKSGAPVGEKFNPVDPTTPGGELKVESVSAITTAVASGNLPAGETQSVGFTINDGKSVTLAQLTEAGYTVQFLATKAVFAGSSAESTTGVLKNGLAAADNFSYKVVISKDDKSYESTLIAVTVQDAAKVVTPTELSLVSGGAVWSLPYITLDNNGTTEGKATVTVTKGLDFAGKEVDAQKDANAHVQEDLAQPATFTSSNPAVALVSNQGVITPLKVGTTVITVKIGDKSKDVTVEVKEAPKASSVEETSVVKAVTATSIDLTVKDQHGEKLRKDSGTLTITTQSETTDVIEGLSNKASVNEKLSLTGLTLKKGTDSILIKDGDKTIGTVKVEVIDTATGTVDSYKIVPVTGKDFELDVYGTSDNTVDIEFQEFVGQAQKGSNIAAPTGDFNVKSTNEEVAQVAVAGGKTTVTAKKAGTTTIQYRQGAIVVASVDVTVKNSTPQITKVELAGQNATQIVLDGDQAASAAAFKSFADQLKLSTAADVYTLAKTGGDYNAIEFATIFDSEDNLTFDELNNSTAATLAVAEVQGNQEGTLVITFSDNYGGKEATFSVKVLDKTKPQAKAIDGTAKATYADGDTLTIEFTEPVKVSELDAIAFADVGDEIASSTIEAVNAQGGYATEFTITLKDGGGKTAKLTAGKKITVAKEKVVDKANNAAAANVEFTAPTP